MDRVRRVVTDRDSGAGALARHPLAGRRTDPQLAAFYHRLMTTQRHCHTQATIAVARKLAERTRVTITTGRPYQLRDTNGDPVTARGAKELIDAHYHVDTRTHPHNRAHTDTMQNSNRHAEHHCRQGIRLHTQRSLEAIVSIPGSLPPIVVGEQGVTVESPQRSEENRP